MLLVVWLFGFDSKQNLLCLQSSKRAFLIFKAKTTTLKNHRNWKWKHTSVHSSHVYWIDNFRLWFLNTNHWTFHWTQIIFYFGVMSCRRQTCSERSLFVRYFLPNLNTFDICDNSHLAFDSLSAIGRPTLLMKSAEKQNHFFSFYVKIVYQNVEIYLPFSSLYVRAPW